MLRFYPPTAVTILNDLLPCLPVSSEYFERPRIVHFGVHSLDVSVCQRIIGRLTVEKVFVEILGTHIQFAHHRAVEVDGDIHCSAQIHIRDYMCPIILEKPENLFFGRAVHNIVVSLPKIVGEDIRLFLLHILNGL